MGGCHPNKENKKRKRTSSSDGSIDSEISNSDVIPEEKKVSINNMRAISTLQCQYCEMILEAMPKFLVNYPY